MKHCARWVAIAALLLPGHAYGGSANGYSATQMWGTTGAGVSVEGALESALTHTQGGVVAAQVNAARAGFLISTGTAQAISIQSIGSQSIVSNTINGNNNRAKNDATQTTTNSGSVKNDGTINLQ